jgi:phosphoribosylamine--glycine ligase
MSRIIHAQRNTIYVIRSTPHVFTKYDIRNTIYAVIFAPMNILLLGGGGREHAFAWKIRQSALCDTLFVAPGNAGTRALATNLDFADDDFASIKKACIENHIAMVIVGPETPLVKGIVDFFAQDHELKGIQIIGPDKIAAQLEGSKDFSKKIMQECHIPTAKYATFTMANINDGLAYLKNHSLPIVLKADGLSAGKGVLICESREEALLEFTAMLKDHKFGEASATVVVEEFLTGIELSVFVVTDGKNYKMLPSAKDYKRIGEKDTGLNTGGMGAISPVPFADAVFLKKVEERIVAPLLIGLQQRGIIYKGFLFVGLMKVKDDPYVIEFNCRMGDPETEVVLPRLKTDIVMICEAIFQNKVNELNIDVIDDTAATVFMVSGGYPGNYEKGKAITGFDEVKDSIIFHAGTTMLHDQIVTNGGRVLAITSFGHSISEAVKKSLASAQIINYEGKYFRTDIGNDLI